jgi:hypothetical protein
LPELRREKGRVVTVSTPSIAAGRAPSRASAADTSELLPVVRLPRLLALIIHLLIFSSLFNGLPGPAALGELRGEGAVLGVAALLLWTAASGALVDVRGIRSTALFLPFLTCAALSFALNADVISNSHFLGREGAEKYFTSLFVVMFYLSAFFAVCCVASVYGPPSILRCAGDAALWCGFLTIGEMAVEVVSWFVPLVREAWAAVRGLWVPTSAEMFRLVGFAPEPSLSAISNLGLLGLLASDWAIRRATGELSARRTWALAFVIGCLFALELLLADARTFSIGVLGAALALAIASGVARTIPATIRSAAIVLLPLPAQAALIWTVLHQNPATRSISNISRSVGMLTGSTLWAQNPLFGVGLGQYGFHFRSVVPSWGLGSFEVSRYFRDDQYDLLAGLPPSFSMFTRVAAELGSIGLLAWLLPPALAVRSALLRPHSALMTILICALAAQIWVGLSFDSYRNIYYWWGLAMLLSWPPARPAMRRAASALHGGMIRRSAAQARARAPEEQTTASAE